MPQVAGTGLMGWQIDLFHVRPGQDPCKVRDVQYDWDEHEGYEVEPSSRESDRWVSEVLALLHRFAIEFGDDFVEVEAPTYDNHGFFTHVRLWQQHGPCIVNVYPLCADVKANTSYAETWDGETFAALWTCCRLLAEEAGCAVFPQYDDDPVDMSMDPQEARGEHNWA